MNEELAWEAYWDNVAHEEPKRSIWDSPLVYAPYIPASIITVKNMDEFNKIFKI